MNRLVLFLLLLCSISADARTLTGSIEFRVRSNLASASAFGLSQDQLDYSWYHGFSAGEIGGTISQLYRADRTVGTASADVLGLVGSLTNSIGETVTFATVKGLYLQNLDGTAVLTVSGLATGTIPPNGAMALTGDRIVASLTPTISVTTTATAEYRIWLVGE